MDLQWSKFSRWAKPEPAKADGRWEGLQGQQEKLQALAPLVTTASHPRDVLATIEGFGAESGRWLKVAAGAKARVLTAAFRRAPVTEGSIALELG
eukprot:6086357-Amphidinium_carterae.1